jgi:adenosylmethionine-8-amino-7-oxononanoate aminotransferase
MCLGKGLTGGYLPLSAALATTEIYNAFLGEPSEMKTLFHGHTFGGNPIAAAVALANIQLFEEPQFFQRLQPTMERLHTQADAVEQYSKVKCIRKVGMMAGIELYDQSVGSGNRICHLARDKNVLLRGLGNVIVVMPPLVTPPESIDQIFEAISYALDQENVD